MLRRLISAIAITAAAVLVPASVAAADDDYGPGELPCVITFETLTVTVGDPFDFTVTCPDLAGATITVQIAFAGQAAAADEAVEVAGADSEELTLDADGTVSSTATVSAAGDYTVQVLDADGEPLSEVYTITAVAAGTGDDDGGLAATGSSSLPYLAAAGGLLLLGLGAIAATRVRARRS
ncbi:hypothetical protein C8K30_104232 [Promicromonospora sp. AC04]|uniref:hypothetical protein n=1 Tax=Promicromonospora sp. AC04 TaxID=2135723 RepID=UPI000D38844B|nr:hypothetical protein [Promicromonospora sp. AC04]PUB27782.1 hypothetical protein C8K30_104232 [Promicromonospora sp. AC04]